MSINQPDEHNRGAALGAGAGRGNKEFTYYTVQRMKIGRPQVRLSLKSTVNVVLGKPSRLLRKYSVSVSIHGHVAFELHVTEGLNVKFQFIKNLILIVTWNW